MLLPFDQLPVRGALADLDTWAQRLDERILSRRWAGRLRRAIEAEAVAASTSMEGVPVTVSDTLKILAGDPPESVADRDRALVIGYRDAMSYVQRRADDGNLRWDRELIVGVHDRVLAGDLSAGSGRLREGAAWVLNERSGDVVFAPPNHEAVPQLVDDVCATLRAADWHPAIAAAWLHVAIAAVHPFKDGNGRTARVLASLAMYRGGFRHPAFTNLEEWWGRNPNIYYEAFSCLGATFAPSTDVTDFVTAHVNAQLAQVIDLALRQRTEGRLWTILENVLADLGLPERLANALYDSFFERDITTGYYRDLIALSAVTARNDLAAASAAGLLRTEGRTRGRRYLPGPRLLPLIARTLGGVEPELQTIVTELVRRASVSLESSRDRAPTQTPLPGFE
ncbi:MAG: Fic family protein [Solirubrobacteraceae bacterium]